ncbi:MAG: hypothetical protein KUG78_07355 [Kangiellaceae bacterium]|nr:hypothetical protein [Kangiellaceae bacterium]
MTYLYPKMRFCILLLVGLFFHNLCSAELAEQEREDLKKPAHLQDLAYGEILYDYYRGDEISALTHILIAQKKNNLPNHTNSAELLSGVIYLNLGMLSKAQTIFNRLLTKEDLKNELLAKLEFYLAKLHYKQRDFADAKRRLTGVYDVLEVELKDQSLIMLSNIALYDKDLETARSWLGQISEDSELLAYSRYNLGILWLTSGDITNSLPYLEKVYTTIEPTDVQRTLQDKAKVALGFHYLKSKDFDTARKYFLGVRLDSSYTNKALLGMGWTYVENQQYEKALSHWLELANRDIRDIAVQEALLAIPFAYQKLKAMKPALENYLEASELFQTQIEMITEIEKQVSEGQLVESLVLKLIKQNEISTADENIQDSKLFGDEYDYYLYELLAQNHFNEGFRNYQKLGRLALMLDHWEQQLPMFSEMLNANQLRFDEKIPQIDAYIQKDSVAEFEKYYQKILHDISEVEHLRSLHLVASEEQFEIHTRLSRLEERLKNIPHSMISAEQREKTKRARGVLDWQLQDNLAEKIWGLNKESTLVSQSILEMRSRTEKLASARSYALTRFVGYQQLIDDGAEKLSRLRLSIKGQVDIQSDYIKQQILAVLRKRKATLNHFLLQSDLSIARLHEQAVFIPEIEE